MYRLLTPHPYPSLAIFPIWLSVPSGSHPDSTTGSRHEIIRRANTAILIKSRIHHTRCPCVNNIAISSRSVERGEEHYDCEYSRFLVRICYRILHARPWAHLRKKPYSLDIVRPIGRLIRHCPPPWISQQSYLHFLWVIRPKSSNISSNFHREENHFSSTEGFI